jgi:rhodanese-related sulfurtransferase
MISMRRTIMLLTAALAISIAIPLGTQAASPHQVDPAGMTPSLNPAFGPWICTDTGGGPICRGSRSDAWTNADSELRCGDDVAELYSRKTVPFLDARRTSVYRDGHIAGSRPFSVWEADVDEKVKAFFAEGTDQSAPIVVYCSGGNCEDSHMLADRLYQVGFDNVLIYKDGYPDWVQRGLPVSKGNEP